MKKLILLFLILIFPVTAGCAGRFGSTPAESSPAPTGSSIIPEVQESLSQELPLLTDAPIISLTDPLSSLMNFYEIRSGNYTWTVPQGEVTSEMIACGFHPLDDAVEQEPLQLPVYQHQDTVLYWINCDYPADEYSLIEWDADDLGNTEAESLSSITFTESSCELQKDRVYQLTLTWSRDKLTERGFAGTASYRFVTE